MRLAGIFSNLATVETPRLLLRPMSLDDAEDMFAYASDPQVVRFTSWNVHQSIDDTRAFLQHTVDAYRDDRAAGWAVEHKADRRMIGTCGFIWWNQADAKAELGYALSRDYWGQGYATEAASASIDFGFQVMRLHRIQAGCVAANTGSVRVLEKIGMTLEGTQREAVLDDYSFADLLLYAILRQEWEARTIC
ncbi:MAG TPA: GNAT family N-acetyltransferase [Thermomicrobiaceae bacterium]|nr:GNAT family N-acetyltransferase [Thermomicrobiaceae bacterium]